VQRILVVDDDPLMRDSLTRTLSQAGYQVQAAASGSEALQLTAEKTFDLVITDLKMANMGGLELLEELRRRGNETPVVVITAYGTIDTAVAAIKGGASDYILKPFKREALLLAVEKALQTERLKRENAFFRRQAGGPDERPIIGRSEALRRALVLLDRYAASSATVLIRGESGTGKELFARRLHQLSPRRDKPFLTVNCAALSAGLLESELFGHEKGAFTGADRRHIGRFEIADGGTLLLDEVSEIDVKLQAKLLRVLQEKEFSRVGSSDTIRVDVRVVATTNRNLEREVASGKFREDLYFRLNKLVVEIPPLRERKEDIPLLVEHFLKKAEKSNGGPPKRLSQEALQALFNYSWPGNVRELENLIERAYLLADGDIIGPELLALGGERITVSKRLDPSALVGKPVQEVEREHILATLRYTNWHQKKAAQLLGIGVRTLREKIKRWNLREAAAQRS